MKFVRFNSLKEVEVTISIENIGLFRHRKDGKCFVSNMQLVDCYFEVTFEEFTKVSDLINQYLINGENK